MREAFLKHQERAIEWFSSFVMLAWAFALAQPGDILPDYGVIFAHKLTKIEVTTLFVVVGLGRCIALYVNGRHPKSPAVRVLGSAAGLVVWGNVASLYYQSVVSSGKWAATPIVYFLLTVFELMSIYRAAYDARYHRAAP